MVLRPAVCPGAGCGATPRSRQVSPARCDPRDGFLRHRALQMREGLRGDINSAVVQAQHALLAQLERTLLGRALGQEQIGIGSARDIDGLVRRDFRRRLPGAVLGGGQHAQAAHLRHRRQPGLFRYVITQHSGAGLGFASTRRARSASAAPFSLTVTTAQPLSSANRISSSARRQDAGARVTGMRDLTQRERASVTELAAPTNGIKTAGQPNLPLRSTRQMGG